MPAGKSLAAGSYATFLDGVRRDAEAKGIPSDIISRALALTRVPNPKVIKLDRHQPEFTLTWAQYREKVLTQEKVAAGKAAVAQNRKTFEEVSAHYSVDMPPLSGIWGLESYYGRITGNFHIIDALATLAYEGRRASFFRSELMKALKILGDGDITPEAMKGSYAGAMGQPQFMPSAYLTYAQSFPAGGPRNIWTSIPDILASIANYLAKCGWRSGEPWGQPVQMPDSLTQSQIGRQNTRTLDAWMQAGVRREDGSRFSRGDVSGAIVRPDGEGGEAFMVYHNFNVIRRYNPSDYYALGVGLMGNMTT
ncbi:lytic murein transglycosylase [Acetobacter sp. AN02]|nr:lytic murein transglycosylase [Acetobacter sp. AN02]MDG6093775.1 lytic murein transglycosylase [Acetobacter sp. AN02]